ncbi:UDP-N-acetylmuramoyl-tripeptide--D-alanyl-D-alanine ligase [Propionibacteriaceae bacterium Y1923]
MRTRSAEWLSRVVEGLLLADADPATPVGPDVVIDARQATPGSVFVALPGERVDGHDYTSQAADNGAAAVLVTRATNSGTTEIRVDDGVAALSALGRAVVADAHTGGLQVLAITGSSGKTSTKDILAQLLEAEAETVAPVGSFNNEIGVPLTATRVGPGTRYLVSEMGARGPGHIAWLCSLVEPDLSLVLNVGSAHLGEFGSVEAIARAKGEIVDTLPATGWAVLNRDDAHVAAMAQRTSAHLAWFTLDRELPRDGALLVRALDATADDLGRYRFTLVVETDAGTEQHPVALALIGRHQVANAAAAAAAAIAVGVAPAKVAATLNSLEHRSRWRMELRVRPDGAAVINDAYNANPDSMRAALAALSEIGAARRRSHPGARVLAVVGDMLELGDEAVTRHQQVGARAAEAGVDELLAIGEQAEHVVAAATAAGIIARSCTVEEASSLDLAPEDVVLVKASRGLALERVAAALLEAGADQAEDNPLNDRRSPATRDTAEEDR